MSPPDTNIETQEHRHKGPLSGMALVVTFAVVLLIGLTVWLGWAGNDPGEAETGTALPTAEQGLAD